MLNPNLIDAINSGNAWAFVGSGCSADAKFPVWDGLLELVISEAASVAGALPGREANAVRSQQKAKRLPEAFSVLKSHYGDTFINEIVTTIFSRDAAPGQLTTTLAEWPFAGYATTNYDHLLETALERHGGWTSIGNTASENRKISGDVRSVVWHPHGGAKLGPKNARLVIASTDYDEIYPAGSPTLSALDALFRMRTIVLVGFGFSDPDLVNTLERVGRLITPSRQGFAFLANCDQAKRDEFWAKYSIDVISYTARGSDHSELARLLAAYGLFVLERDAVFGGRSQTPDYDLATVGLLTHNRLVRAGWTADNDAQQCVARSFVLAQLTQHANRSLADLTESVPGGSPQTKEAVRTAIDTFLSHGVLVATAGRIELSAQGTDFVSSGKAGFELARDQFRASISARLAPTISEPRLLGEIGSTVVGYLERTCRERGLGVAQQIGETGDSESRARAVALLQGAKDELKNAPDREAAMAAIHCIWGILTAPRTEERKYLGLMTQAHFARHLLNVDPASGAIQLKNLQSTAFIADSNFLIPLLAQSSIGHVYASSLAKRLTDAGCKIVTSDLLLEECIEHARWAWTLLDRHGSASATTLDAARGARGYRPNAFLLGYLNDRRFGPGVLFRSYFAEIFDSDGSIPDVVTVTQHLRRREIVVQAISSWRGFRRELWADLDEVTVEIERRRKRNGTYKHERQVKAEGEVALIVTGARRHELTVVDHETRDAYFLSHSRVVDNLPGQAHRICLTPESLYEWLTTITEVTEVDASAVYDQLLWEINRDGVDIVPRLQLLRLFHNTIEASSASLAGVISEHREFLRQHYAQDPEGAFRDVDPLAIPITSEIVSAEALRTMRSRIAVEQEKRTAAEAKAASAVKDAAEFIKLKEEKRERQRRARKAQQRAKSSPKTRKKSKRK